jgi:hypothetical protein
VLKLPVTAAVNCCVWPTVTLAVSGEILTLTGVRITAALAELFGSAWLVAVTITCWDVAMFAGAVYNPLLARLPIGGFNVHFTAVLLLPVTVAVNCCVWSTVSVTIGGETVTPTAESVTVAFADLLGSGTLLAVTITC